MIPLDVSRNISFRKKLNAAFICLCYMFTVIGVFILLFIMGCVLLKGLNGFGMHIFTNDAHNLRGIGNGLRHAIVGQLILALGTSALSIPIGLLAGTYVREYATNVLFVSCVRNASDLLNSTPSIIIATFVYAVIVLPTGHTSGLAGIVALSMIMIPIVLKTTDDMLSTVPCYVKESAMALGAPKHRMILQIAYRTAKGGLLTGVLLAFCRVLGESAPLLFTAGYSEYLTFDITDRMPSLSIAMYNLSTSPRSAFQDLGWNAALLLIGFILFVNLLTRFILAKDRH